MNYAIVGTNWLSRIYADAIAAAGDCFYAVCSRDLARAKAFVGDKAKAFDNIEKLLVDDAIDAVYICLPNNMHVEASLKCLEAGRHVLCEKPITTTAEEYRSLCDVADASGKKYAEAVMNFFSPAMAELKREIAADRVVSVRLDYSQRSSKLDLIRGGGMASSFDKKLCGGVLYDLGVYPLHFAVNLFGEPNQVSATARWLRDVDVSDVLMLAYDEFDVVVTVSKAGQSLIGSEIICDHATYTMQNVSVVLGVEKKDASGAVQIGCGLKQSENPVQNPSFLDGVQARLVRTFTGWANGRDEDGYLALRGESLAVQRIMDEARRQIGY